MTAVSPKPTIALVAILTVAVVLLTGLVDAPLGKAMVVVPLAVGLWATAALPEWFSALAFFTLCMVGKVAAPDTVFAGFASSAIWLVFAGIVIGGAMAHTGLGDRMAARLVPLVSGSFRRSVVGTMLFGLSLTFMMPSAMGRVVLIIPIVTALAVHLGYTKGTKGHRGLVMAGVLGTFMPAFTVLPANVPNNVFLGTVEAMLGAPPTFATYLLLHFPVLGLGKLLLLAPLLILRYRDRPDPDQVAGLVAVPPLAGRERRLALLLALAFVLWATDGIHGITPAWVGMVVALFCLAPGSGLLPDKPLKSMSFEPLFYVAGIVGMGAVAHANGLGAWVAEHVLAVLPLEPDAPAQTFGVLSAVSVVTGLAVTLPGIPAVMTPLTDTLAAATGWSSWAVVMTQVVGYSTVLFPYQAPPLVVAIQVGQLPLREVAWFCAVIAALSILLLWPLDYLWWSLLGWT
ncbi:SLC13 family permease [Rhodospirillum sp. A1_3_36]|uniref:SLC13 family permease n=1 Tax=Rhodospirillum sp. A1_3_36 TaxID=3391666 RepID=UPI0039A59229